MPAADPAVYAKEEAPPPGPQMKQQIVVQAPASSAEQMADEINVDELLGELGGGVAEALGRLPACVQERLAQRMARRATEDKA